MQLNFSSEIVFLLLTSFARCSAHSSVAAQRKRPLRHDAYSTSKDCRQFATLLAFRPVSELCGGLTFHLTGSSCHRY